MRQALAEAPEALVVDTGWALSGRADLPSQRLDAFIVRALGAMRYDALNAGAGELRAGAPALERLVEPAAPALISSNARSAAVSGGLVVEIGGFQVGLVGITSPTADAPDAPDVAEVAPPSEVLPALLRGVRRQADLIVALADLEPAEVQELAGAGLDLDVLLGGRVLQCQALDWVGKTAVVAAGGDGRYVGQLTLEYNPQGQVVHAANRFEVLDRDVPDDPAIAALYAECAQ